MNNKPITETMSERQQSFAEKLAARRKEISEITRRQIRKIRNLPLEQEESLTQEDLEMPSMVQIIENFTNSVANNISSVASGNPLKTSSEDASGRLNICKTCEFFDKNSERCSKCGCKMAIKTYLKAEKCPIGKW